MGVMRCATAPDLTKAQRAICPALLQTIMPAGHIHQAKLPPAEKEPDLRQKIFRNSYGSMYSFARAGMNPDSAIEPQRTQRIP
jgi:hypothetical protein